MKFDIPSSLYDESNKYSELVTKVGRTTTGSGSWISASSGTTYSYTGGETDLLGQLQIVLSDYIIAANDFNNVNLITDETTSTQYKLVIDDGEVYFEEV